MAYNKLPLALGYDDTTGNASGLVEFTLDLSTVGTVCNGKPDTGQALVWSGTHWCPSTIIVTGGGASSFTPPVGTNDGDLIIFDDPAASMGQWNKAVGSSTFFDYGISDKGIVTDSVADNGDVLTKEGGSVIGKTLTEIGGVTSATGDNGDILYKDSGSIVGKTLGELNIATLDQIHASGFARVGQNNDFTASNTFGIGTTFINTDGDLKIGAGSDIFSVDGDNGVVSVGETTVTPSNGSVFVKGDLVIDKAAPFGVAVVNSASSVSSLTAVSGSVVYFSGDNPQPTQAYLSAILSQEGSVVRPHNLGLTNTGDPIAINSAGSFSSLTTTHASQNFIPNLNYSPDDLVPGARLVYVGDGDGEGWQLDTEGGTGGIGKPLASPVGATGKSGTVTANSLILVSGTSVSATRGVALGSNALEFLDNNASATTITANTLNVKGNIAVTGTVDGVDIASRDSTLTSTTTTANNALPKAGGTMTGTLQIDAAAPSLILKDTTDDDDHTILFRNSADTDEFVLRTGDKVGAGLGDCFQLGSISNNPLTLITNTRIGLTIDAAQNVTASASVSSASVSAANLNATNASALNLTGTTITANDINLSGNLTVPDYTGLANAGITTTLHRQVGAPVASSNSTSLTELVSYTLPANILTLGDIDIMIRGRQLAQGSNLRWNFKIAGTNILNSSISQGTYSDFTRYTMHIQISKMATDRQMVTASFRQGTGTGSSAGFSGFASTHRDGLTHNEATGDESGTLELILQAQQSYAAQTVSVDHFTVKLIPDPA